MYQLRPATEKDATDIRLLIRLVGINPMNLDWRRFIVAQAQDDGQVVGCGQVKPHRDGSRELASIAVRPEWRERGIATMIIENLLNDQPGELYLTCRAAMGPFYEKFGFRSIQADKMPAYFRRLTRLVGVLGKMRLAGEGLLVMKRG